jgi:hypothetical protein
MMSDDSKQTLSGADQDSGASQRATPALKSWVTPKVITASFEDAEAGVGLNGDASALLS